MRGLAVIVAGCAIIVTFQVILSVRVKTNESHVHLQDGRIVTCLRPVGIGGGFSCDWANARKP